MGKFSEKLQTAKFKPAEAGNTANPALQILQKKVVNLGLSQVERKEIMKSGGLKRTIIYSWQATL